MLITDNMPKAKAKTGRLKDSGKSADGQLNSRDAKTRQLLVDELLQKTTFYTNNCSTDKLKEYEDISGLVNNIIIIEKALAIDWPRRESHWTEFIDWCRQRNIDPSNVEVANFADFGYGLKAVRDLDEDQLILTVPRSAMMSCESAMKDSALAAFIHSDPLLQHMPNVVLALHVINEYCNSDSDWRCYLSVLPSTYQTPLYYTSRQMLAMKSSQMFEEVVKLRRSIARQYSYFVNQMQVNPTASQLPFKKRFTYELYRWAVSTVMTRQNLIPSSDGTTMISALIPLWDMCNHKNGKFSTDFSIEKDSALCYAMESFKRDQQIFIFYGPRSNGELLVHNGFVYPDNQHDYVLLKLGISGKDLLFRQRNELLKRLGISSSGAFHLHDRSHVIDKQLLAFLRVFHMTRDELESWLQKDDYEDVMKIENDEFNEIDQKAKVFIQVRAKILLRDYKTDEEESASDLEVPRWLVQSEKKILESYIVI